MSHNGKILGKFAMYYRSARNPEPGEIRLIEDASRIAGTAIEWIASSHVSRPSSHAVPAMPSCN
jgi:hypothetical protein